VRAISNENEFLTQRMAVSPLPLHPHDGPNPGHLAQLYGPSWVHISKTARPQAHGTRLPPGPREALFPSRTVGRGKVVTPPVSLRPYDPKIPLDFSRPEYEASIVAPTRRHGKPWSRARRHAQVGHCLDGPGTCERSPWPLVFYGQIRGLVRIFKIVLVPAEYAVMKCDTPLRLGVCITTAKSSPQPDPVSR